MPTVEWLLSDPVVAGLAWVGTILTLIGLLFTYLQARSAKKSAEAASTAAQAAAQAVRKLQGRLNISNLAYANAQLDAVKLLIGQGSFGVAATLLGPIKRVLSQSYHLLLQTSGAEANVGQLKRTIGTIEIQLEYAAANSPNYKPLKIRAALRGLSEYLSAHENQLTFPPEES